MGDRTSLCRFLASMEEDPSSDEAAFFEWARKTNSFEEFAHSLSALRYVVQLPLLFHHNFLLLHIFFSHSNPKVPSCSLCATFLNPKPFFAPFSEPTVSSPPTLVAKRILLFLLYLFTPYRTLHLLGRAPDSLGQDSPPSPVVVELFRSFLTKENVLIMTPPMLDIQCTYLKSPS